MSTSKKVLVIAPSWVGDLVMSQALLRLLKKRDPDCSIDVLASFMLHPLLRRMPEVNNCLVAPWRHGELKLFERFKIAQALRKNSYTHAYILPNSFKSAITPFLARISHRIGWRGEQRYLLLNDMRFCPEKLPLMAERYLALGYKKSEKPKRPFLLPRLQVLPEQLDLVLKRLEISLSGRPILALCPGAEYGSAKRWPPSYFADIARAKSKEGWEVWILGGTKDRILAKEIQVRSYGMCFDLTGKTDIGEVVDLLSLAKAVVANDSGLMHIAAALNKPLVAIYGSTPPNHAPPLSEGKHRKLFLNLPCSPCGKRKCPLNHTNCLYGLGPDLVLKAIADVVG